MLPVTAATLALPPPPIAARAPADKEETAASTAAPLIRQPTIVSADGAAAEPLPAQQRQTADSALGAAPAAASSTAPVAKLSADSTTAIIQETATAVAVATTTALLPFIQQQQQQQPQQQPQQQQQQQQQRLNGGAAEFVPLHQSTPAIAGSWSSPQRVRPDGEFTEMLSPARSTLVAFPVAPRRDPRTTLTDAVLGASADSILFKRAIKLLAGTKPNLDDAYYVLDIDDIVTFINESRAEYQKQHPQRELCSAEPEALRRLAGTLVTRLAECDVISRTAPGTWSSRSGAFPAAGDANVPRALVDLARARHLHGRILQARQAAKQQQTHPSSSSSPSSLSGSTDGSVSALQNKNFQQDVSTNNGSSNINNNNNSDNKGGEVVAVQQE